MADPGDAKFGTPKLPVSIDQRPSFSRRFREAVGVLGKTTQYLISGVRPSGQDFFSPGQPIKPMAPENEAGRRMDYPMAWNTIINPRGEDEITYWELRQLAEVHDVTRLCIETRKDQLESLQWTVRPKREDLSGDEKIEAALRAKATEEFLQFPDGENAFGAWLRMLAEDLMVIDAPSIYVNSADPFSTRFEVVDGATIKRLLGQDGRTPEPPNPAYMQLIKGLPAWLYTADELVYMPRNPRPHRIYGMSPVQQIVLTVNIALRRQFSQLEYYTAGSIPDAFISTPKEWTPEQISAYQQAWDSYFEGNTANRRHAKFVPGEAKITQSREILLKDEFDEWLARVACYAFSLPPTAFVKQMNRATAATAKEAAEEEGLAPLMGWAKRVIDLLIQKFLGQYDLEFAWADKQNTDPETLVALIDKQIRNGTMTINEGRALMGRDGIGPEGDVCMVYMGTQPIPVKQLLLGPPAAPPPDAGGDDDAAEDHDNPPPDPDVDSQEEQEEGEIDRKAREVGKHSHLPFTRAGGTKWRHLAPPPDDTDTIKNAEAEIDKAVLAAFRKTAKSVAKQIKGVLERVYKQEDLDAIDSVDLSGLEILSEGTTLDELSSVTQDSSRYAIASVGVDDRSELVDQVNERAFTFARDRAAELVGMRYDKDGSLIVNPNPKWAITDSTRDMLRGMVSSSMEAGMTPAEIADAIEQMPDSSDIQAFSAGRATMIARTEVIRAHNEGAMIGYRAARDDGVNVKKEWLVGDECCDECQDNADQGPIPLDEDFKSGDDSPPAHPHCRCSVSPVVEQSASQQDDDVDMEEPA